MQRLLTRPWAAAVLRRSGARVVSYQKSGRTWLRLVLEDLGVRARFTHADAEHALATPLEEVGSTAGFEGRPVVFLHRDPRDVAVSWHAHAVHVLGLFDGDLRAFLRHPVLGIAHVCRFNRRWLEAGPNRGPFLPVAYEDMLEDAARETRMVLDFLGLARIGGGRIRSAVAANGFEAMRARERSGELARRHPGKFSDADAPEGARKVRRGRAGAFAEDMDADDIAYCAGVMRAEGFDPAARIPAAPLLAGLRGD